MAKIIMVFLLAITPLPIEAFQTQESTLGEITGAVIFRISQYVTWPENAFSGSEEPFRICVFGKDELNIFEILEKESKIRSMHDRNIMIVSLPTMQSAIEYFNSGATSHVLFITGDSFSFVERLTDLSGKDLTLVLGDSMEFLEAGGMLSIVQRKGNPRLFINNEKVNQSLLKFDSRLMMMVREKR